MTITILCPNNHKLVCPESQAGKRGKCPQCGATFRVPELPATAGVAAGSSITSASAVGAGSSPSTLKPLSAPSVSSALKLNVAAPSPNDPPPPKPTDEAYSIAGATAEPKEPGNPIRPYAEGDAIGSEEILFLCPNEHHLCGSSELGGKPGECPECGVKFLVPSEEDLVEAEPADEPVNVSAFDFDAVDKRSNGRKPAEEKRVEEEPAHNSPALVELFESLWAYRQEGATIELHVGPGKVLVPDGYAPHLSHRGHGVFMVRDANGTHTLLAVNWTSITHIAVRGVKKVPEGVFD